MNNLISFPNTGRKSLRLGLLGRSLQHSLSEPMWNALLAQTSPGSSYENVEVEPTEVEEALEECTQEGFAGLNVTVPYKEVVAQLVGRLDGCALETQAVNCVSFGARCPSASEGGDGASSASLGGSLTGHNTDGPAMLAALSQVGGALPHTGLVLGAGGAARAAVWALEQLGVRRIHVMTRRSAKELAWFTKRGVHLMPWADGLGDWVGDVVVQATPIGFDTLAKGELPRIRWVPDMVALDLVYGASLTPFLSLAAPAGVRLIDGMEILARQAAESWRIWAGWDIPWTQFWDAACGDQPG